MAADKRFTESIKRHWWLCLALWIVGFFGAIALFALVGYDPSPGIEPFSLTYVLVQIIWSITSWSAVVFMLSLGAKHLNYSNKVLAYANEAVLPFYLLHQTVILCVGWFVLGWGIGILPKYTIIAVVSFVLIMALYELLIRPFNIVRFFFGMRPKKRPDAAIS
jgi:peptidoglycan/LPS O-acetylase OafA/YrhL